MPKSMRIGIDARFYGGLGKGLGRYTEKLIHGLERLDTENEYWVFLRYENFDAYEPRSPRFHKVLADFSWYGYHEQFLFPRLLSRYHLDLVHFPHFNVPLGYRRPFVMTLHDLILLHFPTVKASELPPFLYWCKYLIYRFVIASALHRAKHILTVSEFTRQDIEKHYPLCKKKLSVTYEAADKICLWLPPKEVKNIFERLNLSHGGNVQPYCLYVGNAYPHKNLTLLIAVARAFPQLTFTCVGKEDYFYRLFREEVKSAELTNIQFVGFVPDRELSTLYVHAVAYIFPSLYEGFGLPALEACLYGLPVLSSNRGSLPEILGDAALFFDPENSTELIVALKKVIEDERLRTTLRERGQKRQALFDWDTMVRETLALYKTAVR